MIAALLLAQGPALPPPADPAPPPAAAREDIIVVASRLPDVGSDASFGEFAVDRTAIAVAPRPSLEALLPLIPGAQQFRRADSRSSNPTAQGLTLRGLGGNAAARTLVLRGGVPVADPFFGSIAYNALPTANVARISVTPGAGTGPFGSGALAGVIELESSDLLGARGAEAAFTIGSFSTAAASASLARPLGNGAFRLTALGERSDGFWTTPANQRVAANVPAAYRFGVVELETAIPAGAGRLDLRLGLFDDRRTLRFAGADSQSSGADLSLRWISQPTSGWAVEAASWLQVRDFSATTISATSFRPVLEQRAIPALGWGGKLELRPPTSMDGTLRLGIDVRGAEGRTDEVAMAASGAVTLRRRAGGRSLLTGVYVEQDVTAGPLVLGAGTRVDRWSLADGTLRETNAAGALLTDQAFADRTAIRWTARAAATLRIAPDTLLRAAAYRGFRVPTLNELYRPFVLFPVTTRANAALLPERLTGVELGIVHGARQRSGFALTAFANRVEGAIANVTIGPNLRQRANLPAIDAVGVELQGRVAISEAVRLHMSGAWIEAEVDGGALAPGLTGRRPAQTPRWSGALGALIDGPAGSTAALTLRHGGQQFEDDRNADSLPAYTALDMALRLPIGRRLELGLAAENMTGTRIVTRNSGGSIDLGAPRSIRLTLRLN
jgi:iron complex outermembrane receptor protein